MIKQVVLVDENDFEIGTMEKLEAHKKGLLHRAFSVFLFNSKGAFLLQKRAANKYHSAGLWTNACCSHPQPNESVKDSAIKRLHEEMGLNASIYFAFIFQYKVQFDNGLIENEVDHVFFSVCDDLPIPNVNEVESWKYESYENIMNDIRINPNAYTEWFKICVEPLYNYLKKNNVTFNK